MSENSKLELKKRKPPQGQGENGARSIRLSGQGSAFGGPMDDADKNELYENVAEASEDNPSPLQNTAASSLKVDTTEKALPSLGGRLGVYRSNSARRAASSHLKWDHLSGIEEGDLESAASTPTEKDDHEDPFDGAGLLSSEGVSRSFFLTYSNFRPLNFASSSKCDYILDSHGSLSDINSWRNLGCFSECNFIGMFPRFTCIRRMDLAPPLLPEAAFD